LTLHGYDELEASWKKGGPRRGGHRYRIIGSDANGQYGVRLTGDVCEEPVYRTSQPKAQRVAPSVSEWCLARVRPRRRRRRGGAHG
jgi:hypothetical protein